MPFRRREQRFDAEDDPSPFCSGRSDRGLKNPRDVAGLELVEALRILGCERARQEGSPIRLTTLLDGEFHLTVPHHVPLRLGTLKGSLKLVETHHELSVEELLNRLEL